jgi:MFS family permease
MFCLVFGIQEGQSYDWGTISGPLTVWRLIGAGLVVLGVFVFLQSRNRREPLVPLTLFRDRNFSLANLAISSVGFAITAMSLPIMLYAQVVRDLSPTQAALLFVPMALISGALAPGVGRMADRVHPRYLAGFGLAAFSVSLVWLAAVMTPEAAVWELLLPLALLGVANGFMWSPLSTTATRNLPLRYAGAGAGIYNTTRQVGAVLGSASIAVLMQARLTADLPRLPGQGSPAEAGAGALPGFLHDPFATAMAQSLLLPAAVIVVGLLAALAFATPLHLRREPAPAAGVAAETG